MEILYRMSAFAMKTLFLILHYLYGKLNTERPARLPASKNPLLKFTATALAKKIREGEVTSVQVVEAYIARIKEVDPFVNAVVDQRFEEALKEAKSCDEKLKAREMTIEQLQREKPLFGIPLTVKESCSLKGLSLTGCTLVRRGMKADADSVAVQLLRNAGAIPLCATNTPELCAGFESSNFLYGTTKNPYDTRRISGGSSGGEGALIGAGASLIGIGSDLAGSIRVPALFNGIFGHKPTPGILPLTGHYPLVENQKFQKHLVLGPLTRTAEDLHLSMKVLAGRCTKNLRLDEPIDLKNLRVFYSECNKTSVCQLTTEAEISRAIAKATSFLREQGAHVEKSTLVPNDALLEIALSMFFDMEDIPKILIDPDNPKQEKSAVGELIKGIFGLSQYTKPTIFTKLIYDLNALIRPSQLPVYQAQGAEICRRMTDLLGEDGVVILPTFVMSAPFRKTVHLMMLEGAYCLLWNVFGFPSTHVPMGLNEKGLPIGFQVVAGPYQDRLCLEVAKQLESAFGGWVPPTPT